jgi:Ca2+-binding RTX toxin-like protein
MASYGRDIEAEDYPYIALGLPGSPTPTINSSSAIASLIHYSGLDPTETLPFGMRLSPGMSTLLGTGDDDHMRAENGFTTLLGGHGDDLFAGSQYGRQIEKFYGGEGDDLFRWSPGFDIVHGGQPLLAYSADGTDSMDYSGAGEVKITFNRHWIPHKSPNYFAAHDKGAEHLFSVERIQWNARTDHIDLGKGINLLEDDRVQQPHASREDPLLRSGRLIADDPAVLGGAESGSEHADRLVGTNAGEVIDAKGGDDTIYGGAGDDVLVGGAGSDGYVYLVGDGDDVIIDLPHDGDVDELLLTGGVLPEDVTIYRVGAGDLLLSVPMGSIRVSGFFNACGAGIERVVFDHAPAWTRDDLELRAVPIDANAGADGLLLDGQSAPSESHLPAHAPTYGSEWLPEPHMAVIF